MAKKSVEVQVFDSDFAVYLRESVTYEIKMESRSRSRLRGVVLMCILLAVSGIVYFGYFCPEQVCALTSRDTSWSDWTFRFPVQDNLGKPSPLYSSPFTSKISNSGLSYDDVLNDNFQFDMNAHDVMVFLHIQKTGGTSFGRHLVRDLDLQRPCTCQRKRKRCYCFRPNRNEIWLFSRYSTGWKCGLHADWTELTSCVDSELDKNEGDSVKRRYFYITLLREPISRYLSEFRHVQRGATWRNSRHWCGGHAATPQELPHCYKGASWEGVTVDEFAACPHNLAANRQTRMLADLALVGCYNTSYMPSHAERNRVMLASAKRNLAAMAFFGLTEHQKVSQYVFEETFNLRFAVPFEQNNTTLSSATLSSIRPDQIETIRHLNVLDLELYAFAQKLMYQRFERLQKRDSQFHERFAHLGDLPGRQSEAFNWDQIIDADDSSTAPHK
ncbi:heparan-sulfate 6-O-sulfotransferase 1 [Zootermopsis nevadensis]|uniref:Heparan-sulfate 6-O-sulfotransferase n=1 Tax=Zootermopsis nevadensis TaxID=136037 RepID=A0A067R0F1_ZOONE|nr:heparan-sulfate 6-O-sulfotransferase 1 [Zootermopsis nevadensis]KDR10904.1 Heparan-sulfate 6-O-sulfotransferase 1 [Zootermopsis nevadensis]